MYFETNRIKDCNVKTAKSLSFELCRSYMLCLSKSENHWLKIDDPKIHKSCSNLNTLTFVYSISLPKHVISW